MALVKLAVSAALLLSTLTAHAAHGQTTDDEVGTAAVCARDVDGCTEHPEWLDDVRGAAAESGVNVTDLLGAVNVTGMDPRTYLCAADGLLCPPAPPAAAIVSGGCGWPICGPLGQRIWCIEAIESHHGAAMYNPIPVWNGEHAQGFLGWLPSTARSVGVSIGNRASEWSGAAKMLATGRGREFYGVAAHLC